MTTEEQHALATKAVRLTREAIEAVRSLHGELTTEQHVSERQLCYAYDCLCDAAGYLEQVRP